MKYKTLSLYRVEYKFNKISPSKQMAILSGKLLKKKYNLNKQ